MDRRAHTILLMQPTRKAESRTYADYETIIECMEGLCKVFEEHLKRLNPTSSQITYDISQLYEFIESFTDLSVLVFQKSSSTYSPFGKPWIKERIYTMLRKQAGQ
ncbi:enhancer of rudimentary homolog [Corticium candelabrum]|uniref:enhancer of rudimentary homolog n=1 Tax=Corticium candelabrum TaxID=121492 RepID=UPI002E270E47|nr:enhancer of rudimentary homolog [Corticium candelabrum]